MLNVPCCKLSNLNVNLGPTSCKSAFVPSSLNMYRWCLKKMKSLWLCKVTTLLPSKLGLCGNSDASIRPILCPSLVSKLFKIISGTWLVGLAWCWICLFSTVLVSLNAAVGPLGKWLIIKLSKFHYKFLAYLACLLYLRIRVYAYILSLFPTLLFSLSIKGLWLH